jgi:hypothetical protein
MMPSIRELREGFTVWAKTENLDLKKGKLDYESQETYTAWCAWRAALSAAPTPPEVEPVARRVVNGLTEALGFIDSYEIPDARRRIEEAINTIENTSPPSPKAEWDAEGNPLNLEAAARDALKCSDETDCIGLQNALENLREFLGES